jgi:hypothetical protein
MSKNKHMHFLFIEKKHECYIAGSAYRFASQIKAIV